MENLEFLNFKAKLYQEVLNDNVIRQFSDLVSKSISDTFTETTDVSFDAEVETYVIGLDNLLQIAVEQGVLITCIYGSNFPFLAFFLIRPQNLSVLSDILNKRKIDGNRPLGELEKSIALETVNILQGSLIADLSDITDGYIVASIPRYVNPSELSEMLNRFVSQNRDSGDKIILTKSVINSGGTEFAKAVFVFGQPMIECLKKLIK